LLEWDAKRFESLYATFVKRKASEELERYKLAVIGGAWSNSNFDTDDNTNPRQNFIEQLENDVNDRIATIYGMAQPNDEFEIDENDPFWAAMYRNLEKQHGTAKPTADEVERAIADRQDMPDTSSFEIDQIED
jgi:hypothetical protein